MFGSRKALLKQTSYTNGKGGYNATSFASGVTLQDHAAVNGDRVQVFGSTACFTPDCQTPVLMGEAAVQTALLAATTDREAAQAALAEAKTRQDETAEVTCWLSCQKACSSCPQHTNSSLLAFVNALSAAAGAMLVHERASAAAEGEE